MAPEIHNVHRAGGLLRRLERERAIAAVHAGDSHDALRADTRRLRESTREAAVSPLGLGLAAGSGFLTGRLLSVRPRSGGTRRGLSGGLGLLRAIGLIRLFLA